jgi:3-deoxy-manno-octulosonate cytidylyltransferase (CMP-KDO synthetase)
MEKTLIVIPARMGSARFPGKPKALIKGVPMLQRVWRIAKAVPGADVVVGTPDAEVAEFTRSFGGQAVVAPECQGKTGSDCAAIVADRLAATHDIIVNLQGDAPLTPPWVVSQVVEALRREPEVRICTPIVRLEGDAREAFLAMKRAGSATGTTCVFDAKGNALCFSKGVIPSVRDAGEQHPIYRHIGLYGFRREALRTFAGLPQGVFEKIEKLEQLRALEHGIPIRVVEADLKGRAVVSVDSPEDVAAAEAAIDKEGELLG